MTAPTRPIIRYRISTHGHLPGARLTKIGDFGNLPFGSVDEAREAARRDAGRSPHRIQEDVFPPLPEYRRL